MVDINNLLERLRQTAKTPREQGELFERFVIQFLKQDKYYGSLFTNIWKWKDWPGRGNRGDTGIDLVAEERNTGDLWAIQVKFHEGTIYLNDISNFLALSSKKEFKKRMLVTTSPLSKNAEAAMQGQEKGIVVITLSDILASPINWEVFDWNTPENIPLQPPKELRPYQKNAVEAVVKGFERTDRGKLIMPPGSGKTFVSLKIAEKIVGKGGYVLFLAPSIALVEQTLRAYLVDAEIPLRVFAVTSDYTVGRDEDSLERTTILTIPPTTDAEALVATAGIPSSDRMTVIVSTYHSIDVVAEAQKLGLPEFDLIIADEAHRTTGIMKESESGDVSYYHKVHDNNIVKGKKRLYMTATPRVFVPKLKEKLEEMEYSYFSMDDENVYGEEFFRYGFGQAVDEGHLSDYKVVVFTVNEAEVQRRLFEFLNRDDTPELNEAAKIIGVWKALSGQIKDEQIPPLKRAVVFTSRIAESKSFAEQFVKTSRAYYEATENEDEFRIFEVRHVDGSMTATEKKEHLDWLRGEPAPGETRILSNAKVLTEGIDVPALDAVVFLKPRRSVVDVVQAVGRVMRKAPGKRYGYVILPILVDPEREAAQQIEKNEEYRTVWEVLGALRSIDDRFDALVRKLWIDYNKQKSETNNKIKNGQSDTETKVKEIDDRIIIIGTPKQMENPLIFEEQLRNSLLGKIVERVGDRVYLEAYARDVAAATTRLERHINEALQRKDEFGEKTRKEFNNFLEALREIINPSVTEEEARSMLVQHIITKPIFEAIFGEYEFLKENPIARSLDRISEIFETFIQKETQALDAFYRTVKVRAKGLDKEAERQDFLRQLYDSFFKIAFPKTADRLGIVYTPVEVVDFLVKSAEAVLQEEFNLSLKDEGVVILEPFAGTGTFLVRLMHHLPVEALKRKYNEGEIWGNEILLLPYYIALANIESAYYEITGKHEPFKNMLLVDSFQLVEKEKTEQIGIFPEQYTELMKKQREAKINVIISNPPWFAWQEDENMGIKAVKYEKLDQRIKETYAADSSAHLKIALFDSYIRAIRMATDRIENKGVIAFVTNNGFLDGNAADGLRKHLEKDFAKIYILNLRGNARLSGEAWRREGGKIFEQGSRAGVALLILVKDTSKTGPTEIYYHDIGDYLSREEKLARLKEYGDIKGVSWKRIIPNKAHDWINQRSEDFETFPAIGSKQTGDKNRIFELYSSGLKTNRDTWVYNFSKESLENNMRRMINEFNRHVELVKTGEITHDNIDSKVNNDPKEIAWSGDLKTALLRGTSYTFEEGGTIFPSIYRPFTRMVVYFSKVFNNSIYLLPKIFPEPNIENVAITVDGPGGTKGFTAFIVKYIPDLHIMDSGTQVFPLYTYTPVDNNDFSVGHIEGEIIITAKSGKQYIRHENITDWALAEYRKRYGDKVTKEDIFYYVYGLLHSPEYRKRYKNDLKKMLPGIPFVASQEDFWGFSNAGRKLADLHLNYETIEPYPLIEKIKGNPEDPAIYKVTKMRFAKTKDKKDDRTTIIYNDHITLSRIPLETYNYIVNGKSALEWIMERYQVTVDKKSGIINDPNKWLEEQNNPRYIVDLIKRIVRVSIETIKIMNELPPLNIAT